MSTVEDQAAALRAKHGKRWKIWYVPLALGGYTWCARIHGDDLRNVVHADTAGHLDEHIRRDSIPFQRWKVEDVVFSQARQDFGPLFQGIRASQMVFLRVRWLVSARIPGCYRPRLDLRASMGGITEKASRRGCDA